MTYKQITNIIKKIVDNHPIIKNLYFSEEYNINDGYKEHPILHVYIQNVELNTTNGNYNTVEYLLNFNIYDLVESDLKNEIDVQSDLTQCLIDVILALNESFNLSGEYIAVRNNISISRVVMANDSASMGMRTQLRIVGYNKQNNCNTPINTNNL